MDGSLTEDNRSLTEDGSLIEDNRSLTEDIASGVSWAVSIGVDGVSSAVAAPVHAVSGLFSSNGTDQAVASAIDATSVTGVDSEEKSQAVAPDENGSKHATAELTPLSLVPATAGLSPLSPVYFIGDLFRSGEDERQQSAPDENGKQEEEKSPEPNYSCRGVPLHLVTDVSETSKYIPFKVNAAKGHKFENEFFRGEILFLHRLEKWRCADTTGEAWQSHFEGRNRQYEFRLQGCFKKEMEQAFISGEVRHPLDIGWTMAMTIRTLISFALAVARARGASITYNIEAQQDNGRNVWPYISSPLAAANALVRTPAGQDPPDILEPLTETPMSEKLELAKDITTQDTFTIAFWEQYINLERWEICNLPFGWQPSISSVLGNQLLMFSVYTVAEDVADHVINDGELYDEADKHYCVRMFIEPPGFKSGYRRSIWHRLSDQLEPLLRLPRRCLPRLGLICSSKKSKI